MTPFDAGAPLFDELSPPDSDGGAQRTSGRRQWNSEMVNNSAKLAENAGGKPEDLIESPPATEDYTIFTVYYEDEDTSTVVPNAHHVIPGNAALARAPEFLKWLAGEVSVKKEEKGKEKNERVKKRVAKLDPGLSKSQRQAAIDAIVDEELPPMPLVEDPGGMCVWAARGEKIDKHYEPVVKNHVTGEVDFDVNMGFNNIWLPSHCAIADWSSIKDKDAWHMHQDPDKDAPIPFEEAYAYNAMEVSEVQFHDSHGKYSDAVKDELNKIDFKLNQLAVACLDHDDPKKKPYPAPTRVRNALQTLADLVKEKLNILETSPENPWFTSELSLKVTKYW